MCNVYAAAFEQNFISRGTFSAVRVISLSLSLSLILYTVSVYFCQYFYRACNGTCARRTLSTGFIWCGRFLPAPQIRFYPCIHSLPLSSPSFLRTSVQIGPTVILRGWRRGVQTQELWLFATLPPLHSMFGVHVPAVITKWSCTYHVPAVNTKWSCAYHVPAVNIKWSCAYHVPAVITKWSCAYYVHLD